MTNYDKLRAKLAEMFQLDQADLDFGIYRIMNAKRDEILRFLDKDLLPQVRETLATAQGEIGGAGLEELRKAEAQARELGMDPEASPRVRELQAKYGAAGDLGALEEAVFDHLVSFFRRYYDEGDFLSLRRYKEGIYAIPYEGEEVKLHWANADQYYVKTAEHFRDYAFRLGDGRRVHFRLTDAQVERDNNKEREARRFVLREAAAVFEEGGELVLRFEYRATGTKAKQAELNADAERRILEAAPVEWRTALGAAEGKGERTLLGRRLAGYTARNTFDYFVHKDLGGFLTRELDFYIKNEVVRLDDIESETAPRVEAYMAQVRAIRRVGGKIVAFLAQLEDFQKRLWLKKKFVVDTQYLLRVDQLDDCMLEEVATNKAQVDEWVSLFKIDSIKPTLSSPGYSDPPTTGFIKSYPNLVVDTRHFGDGFVQRILSAIPNLDDRISGLLVHSDNFQALSGLTGRFSSQIKAIYIDPPYNTDAGPIDYKNGYRTSSWLSLMFPRVKLAHRLMTQDGVLCATIDDYQVHEFAHILDQVFGKENQLGVSVIRNNPSGRSTVRGLSVCHEYAFFYQRTDEGGLERLPRSEKQLQRFSEEDGEVVDWRNFRKDGGEVTHRAKRPKQYYPIFINPATKELRIPKLYWDKENRIYLLEEQPRATEIVILPIDEKGKDRVWSLNVPSAIENITDLEVRHTKTGAAQVFRRHTPSDGVLPRSWWDKNTYAAREYGSAALTHLFGETNVFSFAKSPYAVQDCIWISGLNEDSSDWVLDFFAGSGTSGHATINLNRKDEGQRKFILVDMGEYFEDVLVKRIKKVSYSPDWKDGQPRHHLGESEIAGSPQMIKIVRLESYEDTLLNLENRRHGTLETLMPPDVREEYMIKYSMKIETAGSPSLLNVAAFTHPFAYTLRIATDTAGETRETAVDLVETFNWLLGLRVGTVDEIKGFRVVTGRLPGTRNREDGDKALIVWRDLDENSNDRLDDFFRRQGYNARDSEFKVVYVNGDHNLQNLYQEGVGPKIRLIEEEFHRLMWDVEGM